DQSTSGEVMTHRNQLDTSRELLEVGALRGPQRVLPEEWNDHFQQLAALPHDVTIAVFFVVVVPLVGEYLTHLEERTDCVQAVDALRTLRDRELVSHLIAGLVATPPRPTGLSDETDREAAFSVYKTNNPAVKDQSFLLIVRTQHIVTILSGGSVGYSEFPANGRMHSSPLLTSGATKGYLRTVIVTAAVYRSFGCELRLAANPLP